MVEELVGYITGNVKRKQIIDVLDKNGSASFEALAKITRIPRLMLEKIMDEMLNKNIVKKEKDKYTLTETGAEVVILTRSIR